MEQTSAADPVKATANIDDALERLSRKLGQSRSVRRGDIVLHLSGEGGGSYRIGGGPGQTTVARSAAGPTDQEPLLQVWGDAAVIRSILDGERDAVKTFVAGGLRIRGDLRYFSDLGLELGLLRRPL